MAVVQISKIQVRRGLKNSGIGVPQLSSAEFAWAVDTQELFIGNGAVADGAPYVGNTRILTEHDNLLELINAYRFEENNAGIISSVPRSMQSKLDEYVSILDFGAVPDGSTDCVEAFENAFEDLFRNADDKFKKVLFIPNGIYLFSSDLRIPGSAILVGENFEKTIFDIGNNNIIFVAESGTTSNFTSTDRPRDIRISNITIDHHDGETVITGSKDCKFENVKWKSGYQLGDTVFVAKNAQGIYVIPTIGTGGFISISGTGVSGTITSTFATTSQNTLSAFVALLQADSTFNSAFEAEIDDSSVIIRSLSPLTLSSSISAAFTLTTLTSSTAPSITTILPILSEFTDGSDSVSPSVFWENTLFGTSVNNVTFDNCIFTQVPLAIECQQDDIFDTAVKFQRCTFYICDTGIYIGGVERQGNNWLIEDCTFEEIARQAFISTDGRGTIISRTRFLNCGNDDGSAANPQTQIIEFNESFGNVVKDCSFNRHQQASIVASETVKGYAEVINVSRADLVDRNYADIFLSDSLRPLAVFSALNRYIYINYTLSLGSLATNIHTRTGTLTISIDSNLSTAAISDHYEYSASSPTAPGGALMTNFEFGVELKDNDLDSGTETLVLYYRNPLSDGATGTISYNISYGV